MKKLYHIFVCGLLFAVTVAMFSSCDKDDNKNHPDDPGTNDPTQPINPSPALPSCVYTLPSGYKVTASNIGSTHFIYDENGRVSSINEYGGWAIINYSEGTITDPWDTYDFTRNDQGYITSINYRWTDDEVDEIEVGEEIYNITYNSENRIAKATCVIKVTITDTAESGITHFIKESSEYSFSWENGSLTKITQKWQTDGTDLPDEEINDFSGEGSYVIQNSKENILKQYTTGLADIFDAFDYSSAIFLSGLLGKAPERLPAVIIATFKDYDKNGNVTYSDQGTYTYTYNLNDDKSIESETETYGLSSYSDTSYYTYQFFGQEPPSQDDDNSGNIGNGGNGGGSGWDKAPSRRASKKNIHRGFRNHLKRH